MNAAPKFKIRTICAVIALSLTSTACQTLPAGGGNQSGVGMSSSNVSDPCSNTSRNIGIAAGAGIGLLIAMATKSNDTGKVVGALIGAGIGGLIGHEMDNRRCELSRVAKKHDLEMVVNDIVPAPDSKGDASESIGLSVSVTDKGNNQFLSNSDVLQDKAKQAFSEIAQQYSSKLQLAKLPAETSPQDRKAAQEALRTKHILLVGHTDDSGNSKLNADLSERRARAVAKLFYAAGVPAENVFYQGAGETLPIADNHDEAGRAKNRRVEIIDTADEGKFQAYLASRKADVKLYRSTNTGNVALAGNTAPSSARAAKKALAQNKAVALKKAVAKNNVLTPAVAQNATSVAASPIAAPSLASAPVQTAAARPAKLGRGEFNFGGDLVTGTPPKLNIGVIAYNHGFSWASVSPIKTAQASDEDMIASASCLFDRPRVANAVKSLRDDKAIKTSDYLPGLNNAAWVGEVNGQMVALTHVAVFRDGTTLARNPDMLVYRDFDPEKPNQKNRKADFIGSPDVNVYRGDNAILYRIFTAGPVRCMDVVIPNNNTAAAPESWLYYQKNQQTYRAVYAARLAR